MTKRTTGNDDCVGESHMRLQILDAMNYLNAVEKTFENEREKYDMFIKILKDFKSQRSSVPEFLGQMKELLEGHDFLIFGLNVFLPKGYKIPSSFDKPEMQAQKKPRKNKKTETSNNNNNNETKEEEEEEEVDLSKFERCGVSYVCLPRDYQIPIASGRSELEASVLNDRIVLNPQGVEEGYNNNSNNKSKRMLNKYQRALFKTEDEQFEMDMLLESVRSACNCLDEVYQNFLLLEEKKNEMDVKKKKKEEGGFQIEEHFRVSHIRLMKRELGGDALEELRNNQSVALPKMLDRLKEKRDELEQRRLERNKVWAQDYAKNHAKSLQF